MNTNKLQFIGSGGITAEVCGWTSDKISLPWAARLWACSPDCYSQPWGTVCIYNGVYCIILSPWPFSIAYILL